MSYSGSLYKLFLIAVLYTGILQYLSVIAFGDWDTTQATCCKVSQSDLKTNSKSVKISYRLNLYFDCISLNIYVLNYLIFICAYLDSM